MKNPAVQADKYESAYFPGFTLTDMRGTWAGQRSPFKVLGHREDPPLRRSWSHHAGLGTSESLPAILGTKGYLSPISKSQNASCRLQLGTQLGLQLPWDFLLPDMSSHGQEQPGHHPMGGPPASVNQALTVTKCLSSLSLFLPGIQTGNACFSTLVLIRG